MLLAIPPPHFWLELGFGLHVHQLKQPHHIIEFSFSKLTLTIVWVFVSTRAEEEKSTSVMISL